MNADQTSGAGAYKADAVDAATVDIVAVETVIVETGPTTEGGGFRAPFRLNLSKTPELKVDYRRTAIAAGALALGYAAFKGVSALIGRGVKANAVATGHTGKLEPVPLAESAAPIKDNAAPRFVGEQPARTDDAAPFVAASSDAADTADLVVEATEVDVVATTPVPGAAADRSAETAEHVPTDLMGDRSPTENERAIDAFRPDPTAPVPEAMRDSLRPATGTPPGFAAARGTFASGLSQTDGSK